MLTLKQFLNEQEEIRSSTHHFDSEEVNKNRETGWKSKSKMVNMPIHHFLGLAAKIDEPMESKQEKVKKVIDSGEKFKDIPFLGFKSEGTHAVVTDHEGRHRAMELQRRGYTHMPVVLRGDIRWSEQDEPRKFDYKETLPRFLHSQDKGRKTVAFPIKRETANEPFSD